MIALVALAALIVPATAVEQSVVIRSSVYNASADQDITISATDFAGFWYDLDSGDSSEEMQIIFKPQTPVDRSVQAGNITYTTTIQQTEYEAGFDDEPGASNQNKTEFPVIGLFAEKYVPLDDDEADELVKLLLDTDDKYTLRTGTALQLPNGYAITAKQIDVEGNKVWMEFSKDGEFIDDEVINVESAGDGVTWTYDTDVGDKDDVIVFRVHVTQVFQGQVDSLAIIEGLWLIDYENILKIEDDDKFGKLEVDSVSAGSIIMESSSAITFSRDKDVSLAQGLAFRVSNDNDHIRFYLMKEYTAPGTYEVRGTVKEGEGDASWNATNFAGFYYDLNDDIGSEELSVTVSGNSIAKDDGTDNGLVYLTSIDQADYEASFAPEPENDDDDTNTSYPVIGLFAEKYVSLDDEEADELVKLLLDTDDKYTLRTGTALQLPNGYAVTAKQIDVEGNKVWMEFSKDGEFIDDQVIDIDTATGGVTWTYDTDVGDKDDVIVFRVHVTQVFQGQVDSLAVIEGLWLVDYENVLKIEDDDKFGKLEVASVTGGSIKMTNPSAITLSRGNDVSIAQNMYFKVADTPSSELRYYPFVKLTIEGEQITQPDDEDTETPVDEGTEAPVDEGTEAPVDEGTEAPVDEPPVETPEKESPGFEAIFAVAGLLAVAYLVRRN
jgi:S-layer protein (TIGR01567 family)